MMDLGIHGIGDSTQTLYALRGGYATTVGRNIGKHVARFFMGHKANSTLMEVYERGSVRRGRATSSCAKPIVTLHDVRPQTVTLEDDLKAFPDYRYLYAKHAMLLECLRNGSSF
ncbi:hypothetical protein IAR50_004117 [Cryptococcus sp. DSM 104548]